MKKRYEKSITLILLVAVGIALLVGCNDSVKGSGHSLQSSVGTDIQTKPTLFGEVENLAEEAEENRGHGGIPGIEFSTRGYGVAYLIKESGSYRVVHNGHSRLNYQLVSHLKISADGMHVAHDYLLGSKRIMVHDGKNGPIFDDVWEPVISPDGLHVAYVARNGDQQHIVVDKAISEGYRSINGNPAFSADSKRIVYTVNDIEQQGTTVYVTDLNFGSRFVKESCEQPQVVSTDQKSIAVIRKEGAKRKVIQFSFEKPDPEKYGASFDGIDKLALDRNGQSVTYVAIRDNKRFIVLDDRAEALPGGELRQPPVVRGGNNGVGVILSSEAGHVLHEAFGGRKSSHPLYSEAAYLVYSPDGSQYAYCARKGKSIFMVVNGKEGPPFDIVVTPVFSPDSRVLAYRARKDGKRFVVISDLAGKVIAQHPGYDVVYEPVFSADGKSVAYGVRDGKQVAWKVEKVSP